MQRQLLIVDDEAIAVEGLKSGIVWEELGISRIFTAYSPDQAKEIIQQEQIDILLCDIEMPQGTGLELLEWVRQHFPRTETIFLTCHADFDYAKQAIQLGSLDYLLKPIPHEELKKSVARALHKLDQESQLNEFSQYGKYWVRHQPLLVERFWIDILNHSIPDDADAIQKAAAERNIPYSNEMTFLPVLIHVKRWFKEITLRDEKIMEYAIRKSAEEVVLNDLDSGLLISLPNGYMLALINGDSDIALHDNLRAVCDKFIEACRSYFYAGVTCHIGEVTHGQQVASTFAKLRNQDVNNVAYDQGVFSLGDARLSTGRHLPPDMNMWSVLLKEGKYKQLLKVMEGYVQTQVIANHMNPQTLNDFIQDFHQMFYYVIKTTGIQAHQLLGDQTSVDLHAVATRSVTDALNWTGHLIKRFEEAAEDQSRSVIDKVKAYIREHLEEEMSREDIAGHVHLNADYLTRIFKKETGVSVSEYLIQQRLDIAAGLLTNTDLPVSTIAGRIGYANFSHFSRMFKKHMNMNPIDYRNTYQNSGMAHESRQSDRERS